MSSFLDLLKRNEANPRIKVTENGSQEIAIQDEAGEEICLSFERQQDGYVCVGSCRVSNPKLANLMRKAVAEFKGDAIVNRIYSSYTMNYIYKHGSVVQIMEITKDHKRLVFEYKDTVGQLERLFQQKRVEQDIQDVLNRINSLLDARNRANHDGEIAAIDNQLKSWTHQLFVLEA
ncbi:non-ribosomal peptide synthetase module [Paenibacillus sp. HJGM_3]|uniref:non-ribosomal peptide synthetase module n=1 Tax=Paenibacillus sp. HJGM_3 TaxID=3379816 RepID=UPI00385D7917